MNMALDLIGYFLRTASWAFFTWVPLATLIIGHVRRSPSHAIVHVVGSFLLAAVIFRWFSTGVFNRGHRRMLLLAATCACISIDLPRRAISNHVGQAELTRSVDSAMIYGLMALILFAELILARHSNHSGRRHE
jgi:hypothetical protein